MKLTYFMLVLVLLLSINTNAQSKRVKEDKSRLQVCVVDDSADALSETAFVQIFAPAIVDSSTKYRGRAKVVTYTLKNKEIYIFKSGKLQGALLHPI